MAKKATRTQYMTASRVSTAFDHNGKRDRKTSIFKIFKTIATHATHMKINIAAKQA
jgi:hypothetical protein